MWYFVLRYKCANSQEALRSGPLASPFSQEFAICRVKWKTWCNHYNFLHLGCETEGDTCTVPEVFQIECSPHQWPHRAQPQAALTHCQWISLLHVLVQSLQLDVTSSPHLVPLEMCFMQYFRCRPTWNQTLYLSSAFTTPLWQERLPK